MSNKPLLTSYHLFVLYFFSSFNVIYKLLLRSLLKTCGINNYLNRIEWGERTIVGLVFWNQTGYAVLNGRVPIGWLGQNPPRQSRHTLRSERQVKVSYLDAVLAKRYRLKWWFVFVGNVGYTDTLHPAWQKRCIGEHITSFTTREWTSIISCHTSWQHGNVSAGFDSSVSSLALVAAGVVFTEQTQVRRIEIPIWHVTINRKQICRPCELDAVTSV